MAGFYNRLKMDGCWEQFEDQVNDRQNDYVLARDAAMRENLTQAPFMSAGRQPDFYGPLVGNRVTRESFLQGRGQVLSKCADCEVVYLPESLFPEYNVRSKCDRADLDALYTRVPKSCNGLMETNVTPYRQMPENYKKGYQGYNAVVYTQIQSRVGSPEKQRPFDPCAPNYGSYAPQRDLSRYAP